MHKAAVGIGAIAYGCIVWMNNNLGSALWVLLAVVAVNFLSSVYTKMQTRDIPHNLMAYTVSIAGTVLAQNQMLIDTRFIKATIILLMLHEIKMTFPVAVAAMKKFGMTDSQATTTVQTIEDVIEQKYPPETKTGR